MVIVQDSLLPNSYVGDADLIYADPPFNIGVKYNKYKDNIDDYVKFARTWVSNCPRTKWFVVCCPPEWLVLYNIILMELGYKYYDTVVWVRTFGQASNTGGRLGRGWTALLIYSKGDNNTNWARIESERQRTGDKRARPDGRIPSNVWELPMVTGNSKEREGWHPAQQPVELVFRVLRGLRPWRVLDPFAGSGTTGVACKEYGRLVDKEIEFTGWEIDDYYVRMANFRIELS